MFTDNRKEEILAVIKSLIDTRSYSGEEQGIVDIMKKFCEDNDFFDFQIDKLGNAIMHIKGNKPGKTIVFDAHMDTVPVLDEDLSKWNTNPFDATIVDNKMFGRGTTDMKGSLGAMICAAKYFVEDYGNDFGGDIYIAGIVHEECFEGVAAREISKNLKPDIVVIGEASDLNIKVGQRGRAEIVVETYGVPAHSSNPSKGVNAVYMMTRIIDEISKLPPNKHRFLEDGIMELTDIISSPYPGKSVVPEFCKVTYDRRLLPGETKESVLKPIEDIINKLSSEDDNFKAKAYFAKGCEMCYTGEEISDDRFFAGWSYDEDTSYVDEVVSAIKSAGYNPQITKYDFCTNGSHYAGEANIKTFGIGPSNETIAHIINEYAPVDELIGASECYYIIMNKLTK